MSSENPESEDPLDQAYPPLDVVDSRWWYWIAIYPLVMVLAIPLLVLMIILFTAPLAVVETSSGTVESGQLLVAGAAIIAILALVVLALAFISTVILPIALYLDARAVARADLEWEPDPILYGLLGLLPYVATPLAGIIVCVYYLFKRHEHVGVP